MKRRDFLAITATGTASLPVLGRKHSWLGMQPLGGTGIEHAVFDDRFEEAKIFGGAMHRLGYPVSPFHGDVTDLWSGYLDVRWRKTADGIAGLTDKDCFFCLSQLAASHGVYPKFRMEHVFTPNGGVSHVINGPANAVAKAGRMLEGKVNWPLIAARLLSSLDLENTSASVRQAVSAGTAVSGRQVAGERDKILVSWVMTPTRQTRVSRQS
ncbi:MAG: hypothetical protein P8126_08105 [Gammaproteobacteria bacterium]|jgi:hypothetical protein